MDHFERAADTKLLSSQTRQETHIQEWKGNYVRVHNWRVLAARWIATRLFWRLATRIQQSRLSFMAAVKTARSSVEVTGLVPGKQAGRWGLPLSYEETRSQSVTCIPSFCAPSMCFSWNANYYVWTKNSKFWIAWMTSKWPVTLNSCSPR